MGIAAVYIATYYFKYNRNVSINLSDWRYDSVRFSAEIILSTNMDYYRMLLYCVDAFRSCTVFNPTALLLIGKWISDIFGKYVGEMLSDRLEPLDHSSNDCSRSIPLNRIHTCRHSYVGWYRAISNQITSIQYIFTFTCTRYVIVDLSTS